MRNQFLASFLITAATVALGSPAMAYAPEGSLMKIKGYSPEVIKLADHQRSRQEWREPAPRSLTPKEKFFHNIYYGDWTDGFDEFGQTVIREE